jgi:uncharacterized protein (DUF362 family)
MNKGLVSVVRTVERAQGVRAVLSDLATSGRNPVRGQAVFIKPNFNTADPCPGSTHNDTLAALVAALWDMGAASIRLGERSWRPTAQVMAEKGVLPLLKNLGVEVVDFDRLPAEDWVLVSPPGSHWPQGFRVARPLLESPCLVGTCCLKTHQYGGVFTLSLKLFVGALPNERLGFPYMSQLHASPQQRRMIAEINQAFSPALLLLDGVEAFVEGGPMTGKLVRAGMLAASNDPVALDAVGVAALKDLGSTPEIMGRAIFAQEQIARAAELGLGAAGPGEIELRAADAASQDYARRLRAVLDQG